ncbi:MAG TPA: hypothetical protein ENI20_11905 [Bacteroides sp.]|nr:hypothetical protein [Bacteroides sp.]
MNQKSSNPVPDWLRDVQNNSYMPELLISGVILLVLFTLDKHIINFGFQFRESFSFAGINLALRMIWVGLAGIPQCRLSDLKESAAWVTD